MDLAGVSLSLRSGPPGGEPTPKHVDLRFYGNLRELLATDRRSGCVTKTFDVPGSVKDAIESCGVPHTEVAFVLVDGVPVDFSYRIRDGDRIAVYPPFHQLDVDPVASVAPPRPPVVRFVVDGHLGTLARHLRLLGFDTAYDPDWTDPQLARCSRIDDRILVTRDVGLLMHGSVVHGYLVRAEAPPAQLDELAARFDLGSQARPFTRCMACNEVLRPVAKEEIEDRLPPRTQRHFDEFRECPGCERVYWDGAHHRRLREIVERVVRSGG